MAIVKFMLHGLTLSIPEAEWAKLVELFIDWPTRTACFDQDGKAERACAVYTVNADGYARELMQAVTGAIRMDPKFNDVAELCRAVVRAICSSPTRFLPAKVSAIQFTSMLRSSTLFLENEVVVEDRVCKGLDKTIVMRINIDALCTYLVANAHKYDGARESFPGWARAFTNVVLPSAITAAAITGVLTWFRNT